MFEVDFGSSCHFWGISWFSTKYTLWNLSRFAVHQSDSIYAVQISFYAKQLYWNRTSE